MLSLLPMVLKTLKVTFAVANPVQHLTRFQLI